MFDFVNVIGKTNKRKGMLSKLLLFMCVEVSLCVAALVWLYAGISKNQNFLRCCEILNVK